VDVGRLAARLALDHLRREVAGGPHEHPGHGQPGRVRPLRDAEVDDYRQFVQQHHVAGLEVSVYDPGGVHRRERVGEAVGQPEQGRRRERPVLGDHLFQGPAGDVAGDDIGHAARQVGVDDRRDIGAAHPAHRLDLARQPAPRHRLLGRDRAQNLERDRLPIGVARHVDDAHPALTDPFEQAVRP
jgi:hypothetical protein